MIREQEPILYSPEIGYWNVSQYDDIAQIFTDTETFGTAGAITLMTPAVPYRYK